MKIIFFGTPNFAATNLKYLLEKEFEFVAIVTPPDSRKGRGKQLKPCAVKEVGIENNIPVLQPLKLRDEEFIEELKYYNADLFVVVAFRMLPEKVWSIPKLGTINLHTSLLPNYRGAAPINWVLINGENQTGITTFFIDNNIDSGEIILQEKIELTNNTTAAELHNTLMINGSKLLTNTLEIIRDGDATINAQILTSEMREAPKITKEMLKIDWGRSANDIHNLIRGLSPFLDSQTKLKDVATCPSAFFILQDEKGVQKRIKIHLSSVIKSDSKKLTSIKTDNKSYLNIVTSNNEISILNLQVEGKNSMSIQQFLQGNKITNNHRVL
jgi:methionyl-tRNA formyltransferase